MKITDTVCDNGLRLITGRIPSSKKARFDFLAGVGSGYDPEEKRGLLHYFEHLAFKGTKHKSLPELESFRRRNILEWGASTGRTTTRYYAETVLRKQEIVFHFLNDIYFYSSFPQEEIEKEREVIINEIARNEDDDAYSAYFALWKSLWEKNPFREHGTGTKKTVGAITREDLLHAQHVWYVPANTTIIATGNVIHDDILARTQHFSSAWPTLPHQTWDDEYDLAPSERDIIITRPQREKAIILLGFKFPMFSDERVRTATHLLSHTLLQRESFLWREIREKRGLAYALDGDILRYDPLISYAYIYIEALPSRVDEVKKILQQYLLAPIKDEALYEEKREWMYDWHTLEYTGNELNAWASLLEASIDMGLPPKTVETLFPKKRKLIKDIALEEVEALRAATFLPEKFVTVTILPE